MKWKWIILAAVALILAVCIGIPVYAHYRLRHRVAKYRAELRQRGEKMTIAEAVPPAPTNGPNGATEFMTAEAQLREESTAFFISDIAAMRWAAPGRARVAWQQAALMSNRTNLWPLAARALASNQVALAELRAALSNPVVRFSVDYEAGIHTPLPHLSQAKRAVHWLAAATLFELHEGRLETAHGNLMALLRTTRSLEEERTLISQLVRIALAHIAAGVVWEGLQHPGWNDTQLAAWQSRWERMDPLRSGESALQMELVLVEPLFVEARMKPDLLATPAPGPTAGNQFREFKDAIEVRVMWPHWLSYEDEYRVLRYCVGGIETLRMAQTNPSLREALKHWEAVRAQVKAECPAETPFSSLFENYGPAQCINKVANTETLRRLVVTAIALRRYQLRHGKFPEKLAVLVPEFLPAEPRDFMDGQPLRYRLNADGTYLLYSIGEDGKDDGGDATIPGDSNARGWWKGRDWVWPLPATKEEIEADEARRWK